MNGLNLNPMFYWNYVMRKNDRLVPEVRFIDFPIEESDLIKLAYNHPQINFTVETEKNPGSLVVSQNNVKYTWRSMLTQKDRLKALNNTDYVVCEENNPMRLEAGLCGVECFGSVEELNEKIDNLKVLDSVERIENWEKTKSLLTN